MSFLLPQIQIIWDQAVANGVGQYLYVFFFFFLVAIAATKYSHVCLRAYSSIENAVVRFLQNRELFYVTDSVREEIWLNLLRLIVGYLLFQRSFWVFYFEVAIDGESARSLISFLDLASSFFIMIGFLTPIFMAFLFLFHTYVHDILLGTYTLGSCLAQILILILLFVPTGRRLSLDGLIMSKHSMGAGFLQKMYAFVGVPTTNRIAIVKFCAFVSYGLLCMYSVYEHFHDPYWFNGTANVLLLSSNWLVSEFAFFRWAFTVYGKPAIIASMVALYIMMLWEFVIIPFTLIKGITRYFVIGWGLAFFTVSMFVLQLSWLPHFQFVLFAILFWPGFFLNRNGRRSLELFYDDRCNLCDRTVRLITALDWFTIVQLRPMSKNEDAIKSCGLTHQEVFDDLYGHDQKTGRIYKGYDLYIQLAARILPLTPLFPVLVLGKLLRVGPPIYSSIARRRRRIFGVCQIPTINLPAAHAREIAAPIVSQINSFFLAFLMTYSIFLAVYLIKFPYFSHIPGWEALRRPFNVVSTTPPALNGQIPITVFTPHVITMGSHYFTVTGVFKGGKEKLLPYVGPNGDRLSLVNLSDRLYFGHSLQWRRLMYGHYHDRICYDAHRDNKFLFSLFKVSELVWAEQPQYFRIDFYYSPIPDPEAAARFEYKRPPKVRVCSVIARPQSRWVIEDDDNNAVRRTSSNLEK